MKDKSGAVLRRLVLIESDWNLKDYFKALAAELKKGINRIRLEFKGGKKPNQPLTKAVLIESDWNLK